MRWLTVVGLVAALALTAGCGDADSSATTDATSTTGAAPVGELAGRSFVSTAIDGHALAPGTHVALAFEPDRLAASAGCNTIAGAYARDGGTLRFDGDPVVTLIGCPPALQRQDKWLVRWLTQGVALSGGGDALRLEGDGVVLELREGPPQGSPPPIAGTRWTLTSLGSRDGVAASVPAGVEPPTLKISADGVAHVFTGCNRGQGPAHVREDGFVDFGPLALTRTACVPPTKQVEAAIAGILSGEVAAGFEQDRLVLTKDGRHLVFSAG